MCSSCFGACTLYLGTNLEHAPWIIHSSMACSVVCFADDQQQLISPGLLMQASAAAAAQAAESGPDTAAQKRRIQAVMKSLQQFVAQPASQPVGSSSSDAGAVEPQGQLVQHLVQQCQEHLARWGSQLPLIGTGKPCSAAD